MILVLSQDDDMGQGERLFFFSTPHVRLSGFFEKEALRNLYGLRACRHLDMFDLTV